MVPLTIVAGALSALLMTPHRPPPVAVHAVTRTVVTPRVVLVRATVDRIRTNADEELRSLLTRDGLPIINVSPRPALTD